MLKGRQVHGSMHHHLLHFEIDRDFWSLLIWPLGLLCQFPVLQLWDNHLINGILEGLESLKGGLRAFAMDQCCM